MPKRWVGTQWIGGSYRREPVYPRTVAEEEELRDMADRILQNPTSDPFSRASASAYLGRAPRSPEESLGLSYARSRRSL
jgi:hypothetical protein